MSSLNPIESEDVITCYSVANRPVRLSKAEIPAGGVAVLLASCGNIDFDQDPEQELATAEPARLQPCMSAPDAFAVVRRYIERNGLGGGNWAGGDVFGPSGRRLGMITYNGSFLAEGHKWAKPDRTVRPGPSM